MEKGEVSNMANEFMSGAKEKNEFASSPSTRNEFASSPSTRNEFASSPSTRNEFASSPSTRNEFAGDRQEQRMRKPRDLSRKSIFAGQFVEGFLKESTFGLYSPEVITEREEEEHLYTAFAGDLVGSFAGTLIGLKGAGAIAKRLPYARTLLTHAMKMMNTGTKGGKFLGGLEKTGLTGAVHGFFSEAIKQAKSENPDLIKVAETTFESGVMFGLTGGVSFGLEASPRMARAIASGTALTGTSTLITLAKGEEVDIKEEAVNFIVGALFEFVTPTRDPGKLHDKIKAYIENLPKEVSEKDFVGMVFRETGVKLKKGDSSEFVKLLKGYKNNIAPKGDFFGFGQLDVPGVNMRTAGKQIEKATKKQKMDIAKLFDKTTSYETGRGKGKNKGKDKARRDLLEEVFGVRSTKDLDVDQAEYTIKTLKKFTKGFADEVERALKLDPVTTPGISKFGTPPIKTIWANNMAPLLDNPTFARMAMDRVKKDARQLTTWMDDVWIRSGGTHDELKQILHGSSTPEGLKKIALIKTNMNKAQNEIYTWYRQLYKTGLMELNAANRFFGKPEISSIDDYLRRRPWMVDRGGSKAKVEGGKGKGFSLRESKPASKKKQSIEFKRTKEEVSVEDLLATPSALYMDFLDQSLQRQLMENPIKVSTQMINAFGDQIPEDAKSWMKGYINNVLLSHPTGLDKAANATLDKTKVTKVVNFFLHKFKKDLGSNPVGSLQKTYSSIMNESKIAYRPRLGARNLTQRYLNIGMYGFGPTFKAMHPFQSAERKTFIKGHEFYRRTSGSSYENPEGSGLGNVFMKKSHESNVYNSLNTALYWVDDMIFNKANWGHKWADPLRMKGGKPEGGAKYFPSELRNVNMELWNAGSSTQFDYSKLGSPELLTGSFNKMLFKFWSWPMNYNFNYMRETSQRFWTGRPGWAASNGPTLPMNARLNVIKQVAFTSAMISVAGKAGIDLSSVGYGLNVTSKGDSGKSPLSMGPMPNQGTHMMQLISANHMMLTGSAQEKARAKSTLKYYFNPVWYLPGSGLAKDVMKAKKAKTLLPLFAPTVRKKRGKK